MKTKPNPENVIVLVIIGDCFSFSNSKSFPRFQAFQSSKACLEYVEGFKGSRTDSEGNFHVSRILETSKCKIGMRREAIGNSKIAQFKALKNRTVQGLKVRLGGNFDVSAITKTPG